MRTEVNATGLRSLLAGTEVFFGTGIISDVFHSEGTVYSIKMNSEIKTGRVSQLDIYKTFKTLENRFSGLHVQALLVFKFSKTSGTSTVI